MNVIEYEGQARNITRLYVKRGPQATPEQRREIAAELLREIADEVEAGEL
jgi:hypothetical protein